MRHATVKHLDHVNLTVEDLDASLDWYGRVFGFTRVEGGVRNGRRWAILRVGEAMICLYEAPGRHVTTDEEAAAHRLHTFGHIGLRITDRPAWEATLVREQVKLGWGDGPVDYPHSTSWYVIDPTGWEIEVALWNDDVVRFDA